MTHQNGAVEIQPWQAHVDPSIDRHGVRQLQFESTLGSVQTGAMILPLKTSPVLPTHMDRRDQWVSRMPTKICVRSHFDWLLVNALGGSRSNENRALWLRSRLNSTPIVPWTEE